MKRIKFVGLFLGIMLLLAGCRKENPEILEVIEVVTESVDEWREQLELGLRYLLEQQYEEAVIAFTSVIHVEPKCMEAYKGRGDAYAVLAMENQDNDGEIEIGEDFVSFQDLVSKAQADYQKVLFLMEETDSQLPDDWDANPEDIYHKLADLYIMLGDLPSALEILQTGNEKYSDGGLCERISQIQEGVNFVLLSQDIYDADDNLLQFYQYTYDENYYLIRIGRYEAFSDSKDMEETFFLTWEMVEELNETGEWGEWILDVGPENSAPTTYYYPGGRSHGTDEWWYDDSETICTNPYPEGDISEIITNTWAQENGFGETSWYTAQYTQDAFQNPVLIKSYDREGNLLGYCKNTFEFYQEE